VAFEGGMEPFESQIKAHALQLANATRQATRPKTLHVASDEVHPYPAIRRRLEDQHAGREAKGGKPAK
jgi:hypothetical protein